ncbi:MAG: deoxyhypusine synthase [archaeon]|nr:MAG: deoxyhypusine synthase [archaeon]
MHARPSDEVLSLVRAMGKMGGFMAPNLEKIASTLDSMQTTGCTRFLSFPADIVATGARGLLIDLVKGGFVDAIITTCGTLDHDIARTLGSYYHGSFDLDDARLRREGFHRLGNVLIPLDSYGPAIEKFLRPVLSRLYKDGTHSTTTESLCKEIGHELGSAHSLLYWAQKREVPVFVPGITDGAVGSQLWLFAERHRDFAVDLMGDERRLSDITSEAKKTGALVIGGGISKHHLIWWNLFRGGLDYACYVTTAMEYDGSLSGAQVREAVSWGKVKVKAAQATLYAEATLVLPLIVSYLQTRSAKRKPASSQNRL